MEIYTKQKANGRSKETGLTSGGVIELPCQNSGVFTAKINAIAITTITLALKISPYIKHWRRSLVLNSPFLTKATCR